MKKKIVLVLIAFLFVFASGACSLNTPDQLSQEERIELIKEIQEFEKRFGFKETDFFKYYDPDTTAYHLYYYTGKTTLPYSYEDPELRNKLFYSLPEDPGIDANLYDIFYYPAEAVAVSGLPITRALLKAPLDRIIFAVIHEDFHEQVDFPLGIEEPMGDLVSYLVALEFAEMKFGQDSDCYKKLERVFGEEYKLSQVFIEYYQLLSELYLNYQLGEFSKEEALAEKEVLLKAMAKDYREVIGKESRYPFNNAYIAFMITYFRYYPPIYEVYLATDENLLETIEIFKTIPVKVQSYSLEKIKKAEKEMADYLEGIIKSKEPTEVGSF